jgi:3-mercaptopyruvate sulfurtransferase SseA
MESEPHRMISRADLLREVTTRRTLLLIEVGALESYRRRHLPGAIWKSEHDLLSEAPRSPDDADLPVVVYAEGPGSPGARRAAALLKAAGFRDVAWYPGGKEDWLLHGHPTVSDSYPPERVQSSEDLGNVPVAWLEAA